MTDWPLYGEGYWEHGEGSNYVAYGDDPGWGPSVALLHDVVPSGPTPFERRTPLLEIACAKGYFVRAALQWGYDAWGIDLSHWAVTHCAPGVEGRIRQGNAVDLPWPDDTFEVVCSWEFLEHVPEDRLPDVLAEMERVARPGALILQRIGTLESEADRSDHLHDATHVTNEPSPWWRDLLAARGWTRRPDVEGKYDVEFAGRDWCGRYFAYEVTKEPRRR